ncbi:class II aldolase/adducin family protein [Taklimakanibacter lacteus]|uniref:class II aldolase/adducin family protein n=1 Tax=Taklimakanibacter lacteus TaxID=2268456 RepID=UPI000E66CB48
MTSVTKLKTKTSEEQQLRIDLAAVFRLAEHFNWHEAVANHFSLAVSPDGKQFLMNPKWKHFSGIKASDLLLLDADDAEAMKRPDAPDETAWCIHGRMHALVPSARCVLHVHPVYATALAGLADPEIKPIDQNTARFYKRVAYDLGYEGMANSDAEGNRLAALLGNHKTMMMGNHGVLIAAASVAEAFDELYYLERACQTLMLAYASGQKLNIMSDKVAEQTARDWDLYADSAFAHFAEMKKVLDRKDPSYAE